MLVHNVHVMIRSALRMAVRRSLLTVNVADAATAPRYRASTPPMRSWTADQLAMFTATAKQKAMFPAFRVSAMTGMRRGEVLGLKWGTVGAVVDGLSMRLIVDTTPRARRDAERVLDDVLAGAGSRALSLL